jgi:hypothetical protein
MTFGYLPTRGQANSNACYWASIFQPTSVRSADRH